MDDIESMPVFMDDLDLEFYPNQPAPSEDIWKKFELLPTPPRSPAHEPSSPGSDDSDDERLLAVTDFLDLDEPIPEIADLFPCCGDNLKSKLIQDCMWSAPMPIGPTAETLLKKTNSRSVLKKDNNVASSSDMINSSECVDPAAVFPYPLSDSNTTPSEASSNSSSAFDTPEVTSESEDEDEDDEEIDVVTVADKIQIRRKPIMPAAASMSAQVAAMHNYSNAQSHSSNYHSAPQSPSHSPSSGTKRSRPISMPASPQPAAKRQRSMCQADFNKRVVQKLHHHSHHRSHGRSSYNNSRNNSSDSEDSEGKRAQHNVLERKRRNDLKSSFHRLRDHVPEIRCQERAPKVVILKKAADYVKSVRAHHRSLEREYESQKLKRDQLKRRLAELRREL